MRKNIVSAVDFVALSVSLMGCSSEGNTSEGVSSPPIVSGIPQPSAEQEAALLSELAEIHPALDHGRSVSRARNVCGDILNGEDGSVITERAWKRFEGGSTGPLNLDQVNGIVLVIEANGFCVES